MKSKAFSLEKFHSLFFASIYVKIGLIDLHCDAFCLVFLPFFKRVPKEKGDDGVDTVGYKLLCSITVLTEPFFC